MIKCSEINRSNLKFYKNMSSILSCPHNKSLAICMINWTWEVSALRRLRHEEHEFKDDLGYVAIPCLSEFFFFFTGIHVC